MKGYRFYLIIFITFTVTSLLAWFLDQYSETGDKLVHFTFWYSNLLFLVVSLVTHFISSAGLEKVEEFHNFYFITMILRFFISLIYIFCFLFVGVKEQTSFVFNFMFLYLLYTSFEIYTLIRNLRGDFKRDEKII